MEKILLESIFNTARDKKIIIIGDIMLDRYLLGSVNRISPEAPVQVFDIEKNEYKLGGAANVCYNVKKLGANPILIGLIGDDPEGLIVKTLMENLNLDTKGLVTEDKRPTTCKTRIIAAAHHLLRIDSESKTDINTNTETIILTKLKEILNDDDIIIVQDYNKGLLTEKLIQKIMETSKEMNARVLVDPKFENFYSYKDAYLFKPNRKELEDASGKKAKNTDEAKALGLDLIRKINCRHLVLTLGELGMMILENNKEEKNSEIISTKARKVADVSGAGDTVISTIAVCLAGGADVKDSVIVSNYAAGLAVEEVGIVAIDRDTLIEHISEAEKEQVSII